MEQLTPVTSSNLDAIGFDGAEIFVRFKSGRVYAYGGDVEEKEDLGALFEDFAKAESTGRFFAQRIKPYLQVRSFVEEE